MFRMALRFLRNLRENKQKGECTHQCARLNNISNDIGVDPNLESCTLNDAEGVSAR